MVELSRSVSGCVAGIVGRALVPITTRSSLRNKDNWDAYDKVMQDNLCQHSG